MSSGSTQPIGRVCISCPTTFMSSGPGFSRSGRNSFIVGSFMKRGVLTLVGCTEFNAERPHQAHHTVFGGDVVAGMRVGLQAADRAGQDDRTATAACLNMWY